MNLFYINIQYENRNIQYLMKLMMYLGNDLIEAIPLDQERIPKPGYVGSFKRSLKEKYREMIMQFADPPEFLVINAGQ
ncbi:MAG: hypothetical protein ABIR15_12035 [Chitinophagaceae bacterium]